MKIFKDRVDGARQLLDRLKKYKGKKKVVVLGLARGGVVTAAEIARELKVPLEVIVVRKIGSPFNPEYAVGAIAEDGTVELSQQDMNISGIPDGLLEPIIEKEKKELERRIKLYRAGSSLKLKGKTAILVDDGIATGRTMRAAIKSVRKSGAKKIIVAVPVITISFLEKIKGEVDDIAYVRLLGPFGAIGAVYKSFPQVEDDEVVVLLGGSKVTSYKE